MDISFLQDIANNATGHTSRRHASGASEVKAGGYSYVAKGMTHYAVFPEEAVLQRHGTGPQGITYADPADDPRKKQ
jgi:hypothetical protein